MKLRVNFLMAGFGLLLLPGLAAATVHTVSQDGLTFIPSELTIEVGDTVQWIWSSGNHTVTSGTDFSDPEVGELFDEALNSSNPVVTYTFTEIDSQDYFCRPHLGLGMTGTIIVTAASAVDNSPAPAAIQLMPNVPNPFNPSTTITFELPAERAGGTAVSLRVYDLKGRLVRVLMEETVIGNRHSVVWDGRNDLGSVAPSGMYFYRLTAGGRILARTMTLAK
jgi:plastocyanin